jgi:hypothetical protein
MNVPFVPTRTRAELAQPAPVGHRHEQLLRIALSLLGQRLSPEAVFVQLRSSYPFDVTDSEIRNVIDWVISKNPQPCGYHYKTRGDNARPLQVSAKPERVTAEQAAANAEKWLNGFRCDECDLWHVSPWRPLEDWRFDSLMLFAAFYDKAEYVNVVTDFTIEQKDGERKANPKGAGKTLLRDDWLRCIREHDATPQSEAGGWIRPNPVKENGSGKGGAVTDADVTSYRFCLLEFDELPMELQLSLFARLPLPIAALVESGGRSVHAWVMLNCSTEQEHRAMIDRIYKRLTCFGLCQGNKNPSRLSRLPGAQREIGKCGDGRQRLLYLNPEPSEAPIFERRD